MLSSIFGKKPEVVKPAQKPVYEFDADGGLVLNNPEKLTVNEVRAAKSIFDSDAFYERLKVVAVAAVAIGGAVGMIYLAGIVSQTVFPLFYTITFEWIAKYNWEYFLTCIVISDFAATAVAALVAYLGIDAIYNAVSHSIANMWKKAESYDNRAKVLTMKQATILVPTPA